MKTSDRKPLIAVTMGDPRGIGPEVLARALAEMSLHEICSPLVVGDGPVLAGTAAHLGLKLNLTEIGPNERHPRSGKIPVLSLSDLTSGRGTGELPPDESARASFRYIEEAAKMAITGKAAAMVTGPVNKEAIHRAGVPFRGHTEYLAGLSGTRDFVMMLAGDRLRVALVTTHVAYRDVPRLLNGRRILSTIGITHSALRDFFGLEKPRLAVAALNPHAGEGGLFGEEETMISRAVARAGQQGVAASGPWPGDTIFYRAVKGEFDAVVCMYHDQALIPLKLLHFDSAVNITLGLPFLRTSVDHGVAFDIAGRGIANHESMVAAIRLAAEMAQRKMGKRGRGKTGKKQGGRMSSFPRKGESG